MPRTHLTLISPDAFRFVNRDNDPRFDAVIDMHKRLGVALDGLCGIKGKARLLV